MRWKGSRRSSNIEDRRQAGFRSSSRGRRRGAKVGGLSIVIALVALFFGKDIGPLLNIMTSHQGSQTEYIQSSQNTSSSVTNADDEAAQFISVVLAQTEDVWGQVFTNAGQQYQAPKLVLYRDQTPTACGMGSAASGPFYCPGDSKVYLDLSFLEQLQRMGAHGDFAVAYVIAHEVAHHIQNLQGISMSVQQAQRQLPQSQANELSVRTELQADCFAGIWAHYIHAQNNILEQGDIEEALNAASTVGDDAIQKSAGKRVNPDAFTHGTSRQRINWFKRGFDSGDILQCDSFNVRL